MNNGPNVMVQDWAGESVLLNLQRSEYYGLDDVNTRIWQTLTENDSIQAAIDVLELKALHYGLSRLKLLA